MISWSGSGSAAFVKSDDGRCEFKTDSGVLVASVKEKGRSFLSLAVPVDAQDISKNTSLNIPVANPGKTGCRVSARINGKKWVAGAVVLEPGESETLEVLFLHNVDKTAKYFGNMDGVPGGGLYIWDPVDPSHISSIQVEIAASGPASITIGNVYASGNYVAGEELASREGYFPFIDQYGQYRHKEWPGKVHSDEDLKKNLEAENCELALLAGPDSFDKFGGWADGPSLKATGNFYVQKLDGMWWLVDPDGKLFWSHGVNCAGFGSGNTQVSGRENYFTGLNPSDTRFNFYTANLTRKYGDAWREKASAGIHTRLRSWGMNTIANWSDATVYMMEPRRTPYTANIGYRAPALDGASYKFPDVFDPQFKESLESGVKRSTERTLNDPWCIGYFIDNELYLSDFKTLSNIAMKQKPEGAAKKALVEYIKGKFTRVSDFNKKYRTKFKSWDLLINETSLPEAAVRDMEGFSELIIDKYYSTCHDAMKKLAPQKLYLGNRFNLYRIYYPDDTLINSVIKKAAVYCDVVSINYYRFACEDLLLPEGFDKPIMIGEFHFGALDRGLPHTGLRNVSSQMQRAEFYSYYVTQALHNPQIVGTHWFQYGDEPYTGRGDGENYQIGFVDVCDSPYPETIMASRNIGYNMYYLRTRK